MRGKMIFLTLALIFLIPCAAGAESAPSQLLELLRDSLIAPYEEVLPLLDTVDKSVVLWYNEEKRTGVFLHGEQLSTARYVRCDVGNSQAVHNRKQGNVGRERKGYPSISEWRVLDFENGSTMERPAAGIW